VGWYGCIFPFTWIHSCLFFIVLMVNQCWICLGVRGFDPQETQLTPHWRFRKTVRAVACDPHGLQLWVFGTTMYLCTSATRICSIHLSHITTNYGQNIDVHMLKCFSFGGLHPRPPTGVLPFDSTGSCPSPLLSTPAKCIISSTVSSLLTFRVVWFSD